MKSQEGKYIERYNYSYKACPKKGIEKPVIFLATSVLIFFLSY